MRYRIRAEAVVVLVVMAGVLTGCSSSSGKPTSGTVPTTSVAPTTVSSTARAPVTTHPVTSTTAPTTAPSGAPTTAAAGSPGLTSPAGNLYHAGEFCPKADLGVTTGGSDGQITCQMVGGYDRWVNG